MDEVTRAVTWEAPEHHHIEKGSDWYWALGIVALSSAIAAFFFGNFLLSILILVGAFSMTLLAIRKPLILPFAVSTRGIRIGDTLYPYSTLESFSIDEDHALGPQLLIQSQKIYMPLMVIPLPEKYLHEIEEIIELRLPEESLEEPFIYKLLEFFGF